MLLEVDNKKTIIYNDNTVSNKLSYFPSCSSLLHSKMALFHRDFETLVTSALIITVASGRPRLLWKKQEIRGTQAR